MKVLDKRIGNTTYYKYRINLPKEIIEEGHFLNVELKVSLKKNNTITIEPKK